MISGVIVHILLSSPGGASAPTYPSTVFQVWSCKSGHIGFYVSKRPLLNRPYSCLNMFTFIQPEELTERSIHIVQPTASSFDKYKDPNERVSV